MAWPPASAAPATGVSGGVLATAMCSPSRVPGLGADPAACTRILDADPVVGVVPRGGGQEWMGFGRMLGVRRVDGVGGVEVGVEGQRVVGVALQGPDAVVMRLGQGVADGVGQQRVRADLHEGGVLGAGRGDGLAEPHRVAQVGRPILGVENDCPGCRSILGGGDHRDGRRLRRQIRQAPLRNSGNIGSMVG